MWDNLVAPENLPFAIALGMLFFIFMVELISFIAGANVFSFMDGIAPDFDVGFDADVDFGALGPVQAALSFLNLGKIPVVFSLLLFLFFFSCIGYNLQLILHEMGVERLPWWLASPIALIACVPIVRYGNAALAKILPKDETSVISGREHIGRIAQITIGTATNDRPAEARVQDHLERTYYVQVVADVPGETFSQGQDVLIVGRRGYLYTAIANTHPNLGFPLHERGKAGNAD